jgi:hypothetical protein
MDVPNKSITTVRKISADKEQVATGVIADIGHRMYGTLQRK